MHHDHPQTDLPETPPPLGQRQPSPHGHLGTRTEAEFDKALIETDPKNFALKLRLRAVQVQQAELNRQWEEVVMKLKAAADNGRFELKSNTKGLHPGIYAKASEHGLKVTGDGTDEVTFSFEEPVR